MNLLTRYRGFIGDVATLATGRGASMAIKLAFTPIIARLFNPSDFGVLAVFGSLVALGSSLATLRYERAIVLAADEAEAGRLAQLTLAVLATSTLLVLAAMLALLALQVEAEFLSALGLWAFAIPVALALTGITQVLEGILSRRAKFRPVAIGDIGQVSTASGLRVVLGALTGSSVWALMLSYVIGQLARVGLLLKAAGRSIPAMQDATRQSLVSTARAWRDFPLHNAPTAFLRDLSNSMPIFALTFVYSPTVAGLYAMATRIVWMPLNTASTALRRVLTQRLARYRQAGKGLLQPSLLMSGVLVITGIVPFGILWLYADWLTTLVLGPQWTTAGEYISLLTPLFFVGWVTRPIGTLFVVLRRQALGLRIQIAVLIARLAVFANAYLHDLSVMQTLAHFVYVSIAGNLFIFVVGVWLARNEGRQ